MLNSGANVNCQKMLAAVTLMFCDGAISYFFKKHRGFLAMVKCYSFGQANFLKTKM